MEKYNEKFYFSVQSMYSGNIRRAEITNCDDITWMGLMTQITEALRGVGYIIPDGTEMIFDRTEGWLRKGIDTGITR